MASDIADLLKEYAAARDEHARLKKIQDKKYDAWQKAAKPFEQEWADALHATDRAFSKVYDLEKQLAKEGGKKAK